MVIYGRSFCVVSTSGDPYGATNSTSSCCGCRTISSIDVTDSYDTYERIYFDSSTVYRGDDKRFNYFDIKNLIQNLDHMFDKLENHKDLYKQN